MTTTPEFEQAYKILNAEQREAVDTIEGPVMVIAGPGTGKTQILTLRISNILKTTDVEPENILALTFTEAAAANMRKRLVKLIGSLAHHVRIATFHSFANDIIQNNPDEFPRIIGSEAMTQVDQVQILQDIILDTELEYLKPFGDTFFYVRPILSALNKLKREGVDPERFLEIVEHEEKRFANIDDLYHEKGAHKGKMKGVYQLLQKKINKNRELAGIYASYQEKLHELRKYDFSDMIMETARALASNDDLLLRLQEEHQYILVDEHQDTNNAQNKLLELLASFHSDPNLFVVGDEKQAIFRFQGASVENFLYFKKLYPNAKLVTLRQNYRSTQAVLDSAHSLLATDNELQANVKYDEKPIDVFTYPDINTEIQAVGEQILALRAQDVAAEEIAVLYRNNRDALAISQTFKSLGIAHIVESDNDLFADSIAMQVMTLLRAVADFGDDEVLARALHLDMVGADALDIVNMVRSASQKRKFSLYDCLKNPKKHLKDVELYKPDALSEFYANLEHWVGLSQNSDVLSAVEAIMQQSGLLQSVMGSEEPEQSLAILNAVFDQVRNFVANNAEAQLADFVSYVDMLREHKLSVRRPLPGGTPGYVRLMTAHRAKGLEFDVVFLMHAYDGNWGNKAKREVLPLLDGVFSLGDAGVEPGAAIDDERRLFYVALTRARQYVVISYPEHNQEGRELVRSQFIDEVEPGLLEFVEETPSDLASRAHLPLTGEDPQLRSSDSSNRDRMQKFVRDAFLKQGLSVSALNNYLKSPWQYFFRNLVRIPSAPNKHQAYGIAVHAALNDLFEKLRLGENMTKAQFIKRFEFHLEQQKGLAGVEFHDTLEKGKKSLPAWFDAYKGDWNVNTLNEFRVNGVYVTPEIRLTGVLDKIEFVDGSSDIVVVDYKTGKPKSRKHIMGETKDSHGDYHRQLVFYKLLLDKFKDGKFNMTEGVIDFIEADPKGKFHRESFSINDDDVLDLEETIKKVGEEIMNLTFWDTECDPKVCDYCDLVEVMRK